MKKAKKNLNFSNVFHFIDNFHAKEKKIWTIAIENFRLIEKNCNLIEKN